MRHSWRKWPITLFIYMCFCSSYFCHWWDKIPDKHTSMEKRAHHSEDGTEKPWWWQCAVQLQGGGGVQCSSRVVAVCGAAPGWWRCMTESPHTLADQKRESVARIKFRYYLLSSTPGDSLLPATPYLPKMPQSLNQCHKLRTKELDH